MQVEPLKPTDEPEKTEPELKPYESPSCETHLPLEHVRKWQDRSSELPF